MKTATILQRLYEEYDIGISMVAFVLGCHENLIWKWKQHIQEPSQAQKDRLQRFLEHLDNSSQNS